MTAEESETLVRRISHEVDLWLTRQVRERNLSDLSIPLEERLSLISNIVTVVLQVVGTCGHKH